MRKWVVYLETMVCSCGSDVKCANGGGGGGGMALWIMDTWLQTLIEVTDFLGRQFDSV